MGMMSKVAGARGGDVGDALTLRLLVTELCRFDTEPRGLFPGQAVQIDHPAPAVSLHAPRRAFDPRGPLSFSVPDHDDRKLEALGLVNREDLDRFGADGVGRVELDGLVHPLPHAGGRRVVVEALVCRELLEEQAELAQTREALRAVRCRSDIPREGRSFQRSRAVAPGGRSESASAQFDNELACLSRSKGGFADRWDVGLRRRLLAKQIRWIHGEEGGTEERRHRYAIVTVRDGSEAQQEKAMKRIFEKQDAPAGGVRDAASNTC